LEFGITRFIWAFIGVAPYAQEVCAFGVKGIAMKSEELRQTLRLLNKVLADPRIEPDQGEQLRCAKRDLALVLRSGKFDRQRVFRIIEVVATVLLETVQDNEIPR
jgi:hypothetical protein